MAGFRCIRGRVGKPQQTRPAASPAMRGMSGTGMRAMGMAKANLRLKKWIMNRLNTRPGTSAAEVTRLPIRSPVCTPGSKHDLVDHDEDDNPLQSHSMYALLEVLSQQFLPNLPIQRTISLCPLFFSICCTSKHPALLRTRDAPLRRTTVKTTAASSTAVWPFQGRTGIVRCPFVHFLCSPATNSS